MPFQDQKSETQRGYLSCFRSHSINGCGISNRTITRLCVCVGGERAGVLLKFNVYIRFRCPITPTHLLSYINSASLSEESGPAKTCSCGILQTGVGHRHGMGNLGLHLPAENSPAPAYKSFLGSYVSLSDPWPRGQDACCGLGRS